MSQNSQFCIGRTLSVTHAKSKTFYFHERADNSYINCRIFHSNSPMSLQLWMMKGQIYDQEGKQEDARDAYKQGVMCAVLKWKFNGT